MSDEGIAFRLIIVVQLLAMGTVRAYFGASRAEKPGAAAAIPRSDIRGGLGSFIVDLADH